jgi:dTDP-4-amino-4,6-dideoxygalactose transaminase
MTAFATVLAIIRAGATPVLADIVAGTALLDMDSVQRCITPRTKAVLLVHLYGQARDVVVWAAFCDANGLTLVEDCAQAHLAVSGGQAAGTFGPIAAHSFYPTKNLGALGDAGAIVTDDPGLASKSSQLRNYGQQERYKHVSLGMNSRLDEMQAAILSARLDWLPEFTERRRVVAERYRCELTNPAVRLLDAPRERGEHVFHQFVVTCDDREALAEHLARRDVASLVHYPVPMHRQPALAGIRIAEGGLTVGERHAQTCLSIPCHPQLTDDDASAVIESVNSFTP